MNKQDDIWTKLQNQSSDAPFKVPDDYFNTLEDQIEARIAAEEGKKSKGKVIRMIKPVLAMAASFALVFLLVYYPLSVFLPDYMAKTSEQHNKQNDLMNEDEAMISYISLSEQSTYDILFFDEAGKADEEVQDEDVLSYLATTMNETEIFAELKN